MGSSLSRALITAAGVLMFSSSHAASLSLLPSLIPGTGATSLDIVLDLINDPSDPNDDVTSIGGGVEFAFSGGLAFAGFTPSVYFNSLNTDPNSLGDFTGFGAPLLNPTELIVGAFDGITGRNSLGSLLVDVTGPGRIDIVDSPSFGGFLTLAGAPLAIELRGAEAPVPLPATAWLFATGFGLISVWRRRR